MAHDDGLAQRIRRILAGHPGYEEKKMFGGICFLLNGSMCCGVVKNYLMARVGAKQHAEYESLPGARPMTFTGRPMEGFL